MLPEDFKKVLPITKHSEVIHWWGTLSKENQEKLSGFYSKGEIQVIDLVNAINTELERREKVAFEADIVRDAEAIEFPNQDYYENLIGHEVYLCARGPTFHICKAHKKLRLYLLLGILPADFHCFIGKNNCEMAQKLKVKRYGYWRLRPAKI